ncbi:MAG: rod shape-determining protein MreC [Coriobacteriia bacterium]|nr:rod shape-determining protein MreC [Coriobacteriia bacterium]
MTAWFRESATGPVHRIQSTVHAMAAPVGAVGEFTTRPARRVFAWASDLGVSRSQLETLRSQNDELRKRVSELEEARLENVRLKGIVAFVEATKTQSIGAKVIGRPTNSWEGVITIDRGTDDGVKAGMPVVGPAGLLGQTVDVTAQSARVRLITDPNSGVAGMLQSSRAEGIVKGSITGDLTFDYVSTATTARAGDVVITSGIGGVFPKGLIVGEVTRVKKGAADLFPEIELAPSSGLAGLEEVLVLIGTVPQTDLGVGE